MANNNTEKRNDIKKGSLADLEERRRNNKKQSIVPQKRKNLIKAVKYVVIAFAVLGILYFVLSAVNSCLKKDNETNNPDEMHFNPEGILSVDYFEPDYDVDILAEKEYLAMNRCVRYTDGNVSIVLDEYAEDELDAGQRFFKDYFNTVISGDYEHYHSFFDDESEVNPAVYGKNPKTKKFPMQRLYDINVKKLFVSEDENNVYNGKKAVFGVYEVSYCIMKNDGEFRLGLPSDKIIPVVYQTATTGAGTENEKTVITKAYLYEDIAENEEGTED